MDEDESSAEGEISTEVKGPSSSIVIVVSTPPAPTKQQQKDEAIINKERNRRRKIRVGTMMCVSYSALIGGTGSLTGSTTQLAFKGILQQQVLICARCI